MSHPKFYVTYCVMDTDAGANPFGHACLILSKQDVEKGPIEAVDSFGYYGQPSSTTNPLIRVLKRLAGFTINLQDSHGMLKQELMRYLDGDGLKGISFEVESEEKIEAIRTACRMRMQQEQETIQELNEYLASQNKPLNAHTRYVAELELAKAQSREPRLKKFHITLNLTPQLGTTPIDADSSDSYSCKHSALDILRENGVIDERTYHLILSSKAKQAFPRFSELYLSPIRLISTGPLLTHHSLRTNINYYYRSWSEDDTVLSNHLFWATPIHTANENSSAIEKKQSERVFKILCDLFNKTRHLECALMDKISEMYKSPEENYYQIKRLEEQLTRINDLMLGFNNPHETYQPNTLEKKLNQAKCMLNATEFMLNPQLINHSFLFRALHNTYSQHAMLGLLLTYASLALLGATPLGVAASTTLALYSGRKLFGFYKQDTHSAEIKSDFMEYNRELLNQKV